MSTLATALQPLFKERAVPVSGTGLGFLRGGILSKTGRAVSADDSLTISAFFAAIDTISNDLAKLPLDVIRAEGRERHVQHSHPIKYLIATRPNSTQVAFMFKKKLVIDAILKGNGFAHIIRDRNNTPVELRVIDQDKQPVQVLSHNNKLFYKFSDTVVGAEDMLHIPGFSLNGLTGVSVITYAAHAIGINLASQEFAQDYYQSKGIGRGIVTTPKDMTPETKIAYGEAISGVLSNQGSGFKVAVVDEAASYTNIKITPQEAEFLKTNKAGVEEVARFLNIPLHKLKVLDNTNNSITEQLEIGHVKDSVEPWAIKFQQVLSAKLLTEEELRTGYSVKANLNSLLRADLKAKTEHYSKGILTGYLTRNEVRAFEDMNPLEGLDEPLTPANQFTQTQLEDQKKENEK